MHPRVSLKLSDDDRIAVRKWSRMRCSSVGIFTLVLLSAESIGARLALDFGSPNAAPLHRICEDWEPHAGEAVGLLVRDTRDATARQAADALFRLRRARRNCRAGWIGLACRDYQAIIRRVADGASTSLCSAEMLGFTAEMAAR